MPYASAVGLLLTGLALAALACERRDRARLLASGVVALVLVSACWSLGGGDLSFRHLLHLTRLDPPRVVFGALPPQAALAFTLIAAVILHITAGRQRWSAVALSGSMVTAIGFTGVFGYATNLASTYPSQGLPPTAFRGALAVSALGLWAVHAAWTAETADAGAPQSIAGPIGMAAVTLSLVLWQALLPLDVAPAIAVLITGLTVASAVALSVRLVQTARRELRRAEASARQLRSEILERHRVERALRESEEKLAKAFTTNPAAVALTRLDDGRFIDVNESWQSVTGHRREDVIGRLSIDLHLWPRPDARDRIADQLHRAGSVHALEQTLVRKSGETFVALISAATLTVAGEELVLWSCLDITDRKRDEEALRESEAQLSAFFNSPNAMRGIVEVTADDEVRFAAVNEMAARSFGLTPASMRGKRADELDLPGELLRRWVAACRRSRDANAPVSFEYCDHPGGRPGWLQIEVTDLGTTADGHARFAYIAEDITGRHEAELRLRSLQATTAALSAALTPRRVGEVALTEGLRMIGATVAAIGLVVDETQELDVWSSVGLPLHGTATWHRYPLASRIALADAARSGQPVTMSSPQAYADAYPDGIAEFSELGLRATAAVPLTVQGRVIGALGFSFAGPRAFSAQDISFLETTAGQTAQALERARLFQEAERRAAALREANERLADADRKKDEFLAILAHELRNPLAPIRFALSLVDAADVTAAAARQGLDVISRQTVHLVRLIDDLLDVSRITRDKIQLRKERVTISALIRAIIEATESQMIAAGHRFTVTALGDGVIDADPTRVLQVFANLLNNAIKFTPPGGEVGLDAGIDGSRVVIQVRDTGVGIPEAALPHVFDMFHQVENSVERSGGLGIGLALAKRLVQMHGGTIEATSAGRGRGATFTVQLPLTEVFEPAGAPPEVAAAADAPTRPLSVLIVDDNVDAAEMLTLVVGQAGHRTRVAHDGPSAIAAATEFGPEVVLLDIGLPGMSGYDVARELRHRHGDTTHLVAITGWGQPEDRRCAREAGFDCHMTKPADVDVLLSYLEAVSHRRQCAGCAKCLRPPLTRAFDDERPIGEPSADPAPPAA